MLKRLLTQKRYFKNIYKEQKGITGLETAIILIAFVVVAAVFAYTVLSAGLFSTQKSQEAVYSGLEETQSTVEIKGSVTTAGLAQINACDALGTWAASANAVTAYAAAGGVEGSGAVTSTITSGVANDEVAYEAMAQRDLATGDVITFWGKFSDAAMSGNVTFAIGTTNDLSTLANRTESLSMVNADTNWHKYTMTLTGATADTAVDVLGFYLTGAIASGVLTIDDFCIDNPAYSTISAPLTCLANTVSFTVSLANGSEGVDFATTSDADADGIISDESTKSHKVVITYSDANQTVADVTWSITKAGKYDSDNILEAGEQFLVTVDLTYINHAMTAANKVDANHTFTLEIKPPVGATLSVERTMGDRLHKVDNLN